jgi:hypothetical protein
MQFSMMVGHRKINVNPNLPCGCRTACIWLVSVVTIKQRMNGCGGVLPENAGGIKRALMVALERNK